MKVIIRNTYFKQSDVPLMSGLPLPVDSEGKIRQTRFENCKFHPNCEGVEFFDCEFINCEGDDYLTRYITPGDFGNWTEKVRD